MVKGTTTGASTDQNGEYELTVPSLQDMLMVTYIGYQRQEVPISGQAQIDIFPIPQNQIDISLDENGESVLTQNPGY